jgi:O-antigen ligase
VFFKLSKLFLYATAFAVAIVLLSSLFPFIVGKYVFFRAAIDLALVFFMLGLVIDPGAGVYIARLKQIARSPLFWAISAFTAIFVLAGFTGLRPAFSFWSNFERGEGGLQMLHLYTFFVLLVTLFREEKEWRRMLWCSLGGATLMILYGLGAGWHIGNFVGARFGDASYRFQGSIGNPAYVAGYLLFIFFYTLILAIRSGALKNRIKALGFGALLVFFGAFFIWTGTRGALIGLVLGVLAFFAYLAYSRARWRKWLIGAGVAIVLAVVILVQFRHTPFISRLPGVRILDISSNAETFSTRTIMWSIAFHGWEHRPLLGYGPENFIQVFDRYFNTRYYVPSAGFGAWFDRAHSIVFDYLAETGILGLLSFASIFVALGLLFRRPLPADWDGKDKQAVVLKGLFFALPIAYLVQGIILFDVLVIYLNLFLFLAFALYVFLPQPVEVPKFEAGPVTYSAALVGIVLAFMACYFGAILPYSKASAFITAEQTANQITTEKDFENHFNPALTNPSPIGGEELPKFLGGDIVNVLPSLAASPDVARSLVGYIEPYLWKDDVRHLLMIGQMHYILWRMTGDKAEYQATEDAFLKAHNIGPKLPQPMYALTSLYQAANLADKVNSEKQQILALWPTATFATSSASR